MIRIVAWLAVGGAALALTGAAIYSAMMAFYAFTFLSGLAFAMFIVGAATSIGLLVLLRRTIMRLTRSRQRYSERGV